MPPGVLQLQASEVAGVRWVLAAELEARYRRADPTLVPMSEDSEVCAAALLACYYGGSPAGQGTGRAGASGMVR